MKIGIGNDHVAVEYKKEIKKYIEEKYGYEVINYGTDSTERFNYPVSGEAVANAVVSGEVDKGIVICGTGVGISLAANKVNGIRCVTCSEPYSALLSRQHNNTNMLAFGARVVGIELAKMIVDAWLSGEYEGGRHQVRIDMLKEIEEKQLVLKMKVGEDGRTFGSISTKEIAAEAKKQLGYDLDKKKMHCEPIKNLGFHDVAIKVHPQVTATLRVKVEEK